jgi:gamma-glutamylcyclotransferase
MTKYFAYGTNCNLAVMEQKGIRFTARQRAVLDGFRLRFNKRSSRESLPERIGFANIEEDQEGTVEGILYDLGVDGLETLDETERHQSHYDRIRVVVNADSGSEECWTYKARPEVVAEGLVPSRNYINHILAGQEFLSQQYFDALDQSQTYRDTCACCDREEEVLFVRGNDRLHALCQSCREARMKWGDVIHRPLSVEETAAVMRQLVLDGPGFGSIEELIEEAIRREIIAK